MKTTKPKMTMQPVDSSSVSHIGHDGNTLHVTFKGSGKTYAYPCVTVNDFNALRAAKSVGKHLNTSIMPGRTGKLVP